jgi:hypothetical protein
MVRPVEVPPYSDAPRGRRMVSDTSMPLYTRVLFGEFVSNSFTDPKMPSPGLPML